MNLIVEFLPMKTAKEHAETELEAMVRSNNFCDAIILHGINEIT